PNPHPGMMVDDPPDRQPRPHGDQAAGDPPGPLTHAIGPRGPGLAPRLGTRASPHPGLTLRGHGSGARARPGAPLRPALRRWQWSGPRSETPDLIRAARVVSRDDVARHVPEGVAWQTPAERAARRRERQAAYDARLAARTT